MEQLLYRPRSPTVASRLFRELAGEWRHRERADSERLVWLDTFDWRLLDRERVLRWQNGGGAGQLVLESAEGQPLRRMEVDRLPTFAEALPPSPLRDELERATAPRRLLVVAEGRRRRQQLLLLDQRDKTVARVSFEELAVRAPGSKRFGETLEIVRVLPVLGYRRVLEDLEHRLDTSELERLPTTPMELVLSAAGRRAFDYSSKLDLVLDPTERADVAVKRIHRRLLEVIRANRAGTIEDLDPEFLHDLRVAVRRTRSLLTQVKGVFPVRRVEGFRQGFRWLQGVTGPTRDLHVWLLELPTLCGRVDAEPEELLPLERHLRARLDREHRALVRVLEGKRYSGLLERWQAFLDEPAAERTTLPNARRPVVEVASERIWRVYRRLRREGRAITDASPAGELHALRIRGKKLRYLLEAFRSLYPESIADQIRSLKRLQDNLGDFNDCSVQRAALRRFADGMAAAGTLPPETSLLLGRLDAAIEARARELRHEFADRFSQFAHRDNHRHYREMFRRPRGEAP